MRWLGCPLTYLSPLRSAVTFSCVILTHLFVWYLDSILRASNAILRVTEQAWWDGQKLSDINISAVCRELRKTYFFIWSSRAVLPWLMSISGRRWLCQFLISALTSLLCGYPGAPRPHYYISGDIIVLHNQSHVSLKVKRKKLGSENFYERD